VPAEPPAAPPAALAFAIVSRGRPQGLAVLLAALDRQAAALPGGGCVIRVVLNQELDPGYAAVFAEAAARPTPLAWRSVLEPGIPAARNALVAWVLEERPAAAVFLDDDELPPDGWLDRLCALRREHPDCILTGPVRAAPAGPGTFLSRHGAYDRVRRLPEGAPTGEAYTNNTLVPLAVFEALGPSFDRRFTRTGGSDTEWFRRAGRAGFAIRYFQSLAVLETVEPGRVQLRAVLTRWIRNGSTDTLIRRLQHPGLRSVAGIVVRGGGKMLLGTGRALLFAVLLRWGSMLRGLRLALGGLGSLLGLFAYSPRQY